MIASLRRVLPFVALLILATALVWWWWTFFSVVGYGYLSWSEAGLCLVSDNDICALAKALCLGAHPQGIVAYGAGAFWIGAALLSTSLWTAGRRGPSSVARG